MADILRGKIGRENFDELETVLGDWLQDNPGSAGALDVLEELSATNPRLVKDYLYTVARRWRAMASEADDNEEAQHYLSNANRTVRLLRQL